MRHDEEVPYGSGRGGWRRRVLPAALAMAGTSLFAAACGTGTVAGARTQGPAATQGTPAVTQPTTAPRPAHHTSKPKPPATTTTTTTAPPAAPRSDAPPVCDASQLAASFAQVQGASYAGHVVYLLVLKNDSTTTCTVSGVPSMLLLDDQQHALPTSVEQNPPAPTTTVTLAPGDPAYSEASFSPDVPGVGEPADGNQCEPTAASVRVSWTGTDSSTVTALQPATPVCERGSLAMSVLSGTYPSNI